MAKSVRGTVVLDGVEYEAKTCTKCGEMKPIEGYGIQSNVKDGRKSRCKTCLAETSRKYNKDNPDKRRQAERNWRERNQDAVKEMAKRSRQKHKDDYKRRLERWKAANPERDKALKRTHSHKRRSLKNSLTYDFDASESNLIRGIYEGCAFTGAKDNLHDDHFIALSTGHGGTYLANIIPLSASLNLSKSNKNPFEWMNDVDDVINYEQLANSMVTLAYLNGVTLADYIEFVYWCYDNPRKPEDINDDNRDSLAYWMRINNRRYIA